VTPIGGCCESYQWAISAPSGANPLRARLACGVVVGRRSRGAFPANARWRSSQPLNGLLRGGFGLVSVRFQDDPGFYRTAVAFKNKPAPDNPVPAWIFSEPVTVVALWLPHGRNMTCSVANFQAGWSPTDSNGTFRSRLRPDSSTNCRIWDASTYFSAPSRFGVVAPSPADALQDDAREPLSCRGSRERSTGPIHASCASHVCV
jgi:hypothetical protein